jgi:hypothetical protein
MHVRSSKHSWPWLSASAGLLLGAACTIDVPLGSRADEDEAPTPASEPSDVLPLQPIAIEERFEPGPGCDPGPHDDLDGDGFSLAQGDCNDCVALIGPSSIEVLEPPGVDENCDGVIDEPLLTCDAALPIDSKDPFVAARAIELCRIARGPLDWGVLEAHWVLPDGSEASPEFLGPFHQGHGIVDDLGPNVSPRRGLNMLALSTGSARRPADHDHQSAVGMDKGYESAHPAGFPKESAACLATTGAPHDGIALQVDMRAPRNAKALAFDFDFYTYEWPKFICSENNDFFIALMDPPPASAIDGNISFDGEGNPVSVNNAFLEVCTCPGHPTSPCLAGGKAFECNFGSAELLGTGFGADTEAIGHAATSWLLTQAPVVPGEPVQIRFAVYDSENGTHDSLTLIDNVRWVAKSAGHATTRVPD